MKLSEWRNNFINWLGDRITIHSLYLDDPEKPGDTNVFLPPLRNIKNWDADGTLRVTATQDVYITTRYDRSIPYFQLPMSTIEGLYSSLAHRLLITYQEIADINDLWFNPSDIPIIVEEHGDATGDWLVTMKYILVFQAISEEEEPPADRFVTKINLGVYREYLDESDMTLDYSGTTNLAYVADDETGLLNDDGGALF